MRPTARWWAAALAGFALVVVAVLANRPLVLGAPIGIGGWLVGVALLLSHRVVLQRDRLSVEYTVAATGPIVETTTTATLTATRPSTHASLPVSVIVDTPPGISSVEPVSTLRLASGDTEASGTGRLSFPIAGEFVFEPPQVVIADPFGLYQVTLTEGSSPTVTVQEQPSAFHVGQGGEAVTNAYGEHVTTRTGPGIVPQEIREYVPGDDVRQVDWKTTARLADLYIRETEGESNRNTLLIVDHRDRMQAGSAGETMLDYARSLGIGIVHTAASQADPLGVYTVGVDGITDIVQSSTTAKTYGRATTILHGLTPTGDTTMRAARSAGTARQLGERLDTETAFGRVLSPYLTDSTSYTVRIRDDPLVGAVQRAQLTDRTESLVVLITTDVDPTRLQEAVTIAIKGRNRVMVFITPQCLFEPAQMTALDELYDRYLSFETLRRTLDRHPRVSVFEVAAGSRLKRILAHRRGREAAP